LEEADYLPRTSTWKNKQRTLLFSSRGITQRYRHLMDDLKKLLPHHKSTAKWEKKQTLKDINELCELSSCNNCLFFECRNHRELYMWMAKPPHGPSVKFEVLNVHTMGEIKLSGNCLLHSRPLLSFDAHFDNEPHLRLLKEMFLQSFGTPRNHPKSKPFFDHVMSFCLYDSKIWFRHYEVSPVVAGDSSDTQRLVLTEIGPRFVLNPIRIFDGSFCGSCIYLNPDYMSPRAVRVGLKQQYRMKYVAKMGAEKTRKERRKQKTIPEDGYDPNSIFS